MNLPSATRLTLVAAASAAVLSLAFAADDLHKCDSRRWFRSVGSDRQLDVKACLLGGIDLETRNDAGCTAVHVAVTNKHLGLLKLLHEKGADLEAKCVSTSKTPLMRAAKMNDLEAVKFLIETANVDPFTKVTDTKGTWTALTFAAWEGHLEVVMYFHRLEQHALPKTSQEFEGTWLMWAAASGEAEIAELLSDGKEPGGTELEAVDAHGFTAAFWAATMGKLDALKALVGKGAKVTVVSKSGLSMLMSAAFWGHVDVVNYLVGQGVHPDQHDAAGWTACMWAAANGKTEALQALEVHGDSCHDENGGGWTALMMAAASGHPDTATWLVMKGADPNQRNHNGQTVLDMAHTRHNPGLYELLMAHMHGEDWHLIGQSEGATGEHSDPPRNHPTLHEDTAKTAHLRTDLKQPRQVHKVPPSDKNGASPQQKDGRSSGGHAEL